LGVGLRALWCPSRGLRALRAPAPQPPIGRASGGVPSPPLGAPAACCARGRPPRALWRLLYRGFRRWGGGMWWAPPAAPSRPYVAHPPPAGPCPACRVPALSRRLVCGVVSLVLSGGLGCVGLRGLRPCWGSVAGRSAPCACPLRGRRAPWPPSPLHRGRAAGRYARPAPPCGMDAGAAARPLPATWWPGLVCWLFPAWVPARLVPALRDGNECGRASTTGHAAGSHLLAVCWPLVGAGLIRWPPFPLRTIKGAFLSQIWSCSPTVPGMLPCCPASLPPGLGLRWPAGHRCALVGAACRGRAFARASPAPGACPSSTGTLLATTYCCLPGSHAVPLTRFVAMFCHVRRLRPSPGIPCPASLPAASFLQYARLCGVPWRTL